MEILIRLILSNPALSLLILGIVIAGIKILLNRHNLTKKLAAEAFVSYYFLFAIGIGYIDNFVMHTIFADFTAKFIGWENSPFQYEVGWVSLGIGIAGIMAFKNNFNFRLATLIVPTVFLWGAAGGHIYQIIEAGNHAQGNAGSILYTDIFIPVVGIVLLVWSWKEGKSDSM